VAKNVCHLRLALVQAGRGGRAEDWGGGAGQKEQSDVWLWCRKCLAVV